MPNLSRILITGMGVVSAIGNDLSENRRSLASGKNGISSLEYYPTAFAGKRPCGEIKSSDQDLREKISGTAAISCSRTSLLAMLAFEEAVKDSGISSEIVSSPDTAVIGATTVGGMCMTDELYADAHGAAQGSIYLSSYDYGSVMMAIQEKYGLQGMVDSINTACSSSANAIMFGARLIRQGYATRAIVGGSDSLAKFTINGFNALHILSPDLCIPFDRDRRGLNLGEGAAFLVLEKESLVKDKKIYAALSGYGNSNDAFHPSSISDDGEGPFLSMQEALTRARLASSAISYINAHGTGTENNDLTETRAMQRVFNQPPPFASTKSYTGHTLGAAGAIEAVYSILSIGEQEIYPTLRHEHAMPETGLAPLRHYEKHAVSHVMSNSFGFGGNCSTLIFSKA